MRKSGRTRHEHWNGRHKFEHWYRDNSVYFITARVRGGLHAFKSAESQKIFFDKLGQYAGEIGFEVWIVTLMVNHYHVIGYLRDGSRLGQMMRKLHGSVAKLVNDTLDNRHVPFWREGWHHDYFDGCLRDEKQLRRSYRYVLTQGRRAGLVGPDEPYPGTDAIITVEECVARAHELKAFLPNVPYKRYQK